MTIYFDEKKQAYGFEIENPLLTLEDDVWQKYAGKDNWDIVDGKFVDITDTENYQAKVAEKGNAIKKAELLSQIDEIDKRRIRAIAEPQIRDSATGQTWLEFYTTQIADLRKQISTL